MDRIAPLVPAANETTWMALVYGLPALVVLLVLVGVARSRRSARRRPTPSAPPRLRQTPGP